MEFEELANIWRGSDEELENKVKINKELLKEVSMNKIRKGLSEFKWEAILEIVGAYLFLDFITGFTLAHTAEVEFLIPALILFGATITTFALSGYKLFLYYSINSNASVLQTQKRLARLQYVERFDINLLYIFIPLLSAPMLIVGAKALMGISLYFLKTQLIYYTIGSFVVAVILVFILKRFPNRNLQRSIALLREIRETEK